MVQISFPFKDSLPLCNEGRGQGTSPFGGNPPKVDVGARGLRSPSYRDGDGYGLCTESLGSESSCDGSVGDGDEIASLMATVEYEGNELPSRTRRKEEAGRGGRRDFPPPLSSLVHVGATRRRSFVRGVRHDGRLVLTQVTVEIESPRIFHACRRDGRLQLHLARQHQVADDGDGMEEEMETRDDDDDDDDDKEEVVEEEVELRKEQQDAEARKEQVEDVHVTIVAWNKEQVEEEEEEEEEAEEEGGVKVALKPSSWQWVQEGCYNRRCHDVPTGGGGGGSAPGRFPLFWSNPQFMTTA